MNGLGGLALFVILIFVIPSAVLGLYSALIYHLLKRLPGKLKNFIPPVLAVLFLLMMRFPPHVGGEMVVVAGYLLLFGVLTAFVFLILTPLSLLEIFVAFRRGEVVAFSCTTVSLSIFFMRGFSEVMSAPSSPGSALMSYLELVGVSFFVAVIALAIEMLGEEPLINRN